MSVTLALQLKFYGVKTLLESYTEQDAQAKEAREKNQALAQQLEDKAFQENSAEAFTLGATPGSAGVQVQPTAGSDQDLFTTPNESPTTATHLLEQTDTQADAAQVTEQATEQTNTPIEDFGEKLGGARKDEIVEARERLANMDDEQGNVAMFSLSNETRYLDQKKSPVVSDRSGLRLPRDVRHLRDH